MPRVKLLPDLGALIIGAASVQGFKDADLAEMLGMSRQSFNGKKSRLLDELSFNDVIKLCRELGISREQVTNLIYLKKQ